MTNTSIVVISCIHNDNTIDYSPPALEPMIMISCMFTMILGCLYDCYLNIYYRLMSYYRAYDVDYE